MLRQWPAGRHLLRMASSADPGVRARVVQALRDVGSSRHSDVQQMGIETLAALPPDDAAPLVDLAEAWLSRDARSVMVIKRSMSPGFAGIDNDLYYMEKTLMLFGDAKVFVGNIVKELNAAVATR